MNLPVCEQSPPAGPSPACPPADDGREPLPAAPGYSRANPSPRYRELTAYYRHMHENGIPDQGIAASETFDGRSLQAHTATPRRIIGVLGSKTLFDYGAGKGTQYGPARITASDGHEYPDLGTFLGVDSVTCYDPGYAPFDSLPRARFDGVISTDVLEHCPAEDIPWIIDEIFSFADEFVYLNVACYPAKKLLPNGENAHCTIEPPEWWKAHLDRALGQRPGLRYYAVYYVPDPQPNGSSAMGQVLFQEKAPAI